VPTSHDRVREAPSRARITGATHRSSRRSRGPTPAPREAFFGNDGRRQFFELFQASKVAESDLSGVEQIESARHRFLDGVRHTAESAIFDVRLPDGELLRLAVDRHGKVDDVFTVLQEALGLANEKTVLRLNGRRLDADQAIADLGVRL
jgi:hypothetical protein